MFFLPLHCAPLFIFLFFISSFHPCIFILHFFPAAPLVLFSMCGPQVSVFYACISFLPMHFLFCSPIYFSIFIIHHLPVNFLSPRLFLHPCLLEGNISAVQFSSIPHFLLFFSICTYLKCITRYITIWFYPPEPSSLSGCLADCQFRV